MLDWSPGRAAELISPEGRDARVTGRKLTVEEVPRIQRAVAQKLVQRAMQGIGAGLRHDGNLPAAPVAVLGGVQVGDDIEFLHRLNPKQLSAHAARRRADGVGSARKFHSIPQENILAGAPAADRKIVPRSGAAGGGLLDRSGIHHGRVE